MADLQGGIYWDHGSKPPRCYAVAFLKADASATSAQIHAALNALVSCWDRLKQGLTPELPNLPVPPENFDWLLGFGKKAFDIAGKKRPVPRRLRAPFTFNSVEPTGGGLAVDGSGLRYAGGVARNVATEEFCVQFTGDTPLSVARGVVETVQLLESLRDPTTGKAALLVSAAFSGFNREDQRSWLGFHDGISNLMSGQQRKRAITIAEAGLSDQDEWTVDGTYMAFMRLAVDLPAWRRINQDDQELLVGRAKASGCPLRARAGGTSIVVAGCPIQGSTQITDEGNAQFREPPDGVDDTIRISHVQRANHHIDAQRIYRQGYEFMDPPEAGKPLSVGLNFVSFQESPERLFFMLRTDGWLGGVNFGGDPGPDLLTVIAAAIFLCPPRIAGEDYPGASVFSQAIA